MLDKVLTLKVNTKTKDDVEDVARQWDLAPGTVVRAALYFFLEDYLSPLSPSEKIVQMLQHAKENGGRLAMDDLVEVSFEAEPIAGAAPAPTAAAPPELLEELEYKAFLLTMREDSKRRRKLIADMDARLARKKAGGPK